MGFFGKLANVATGGMLGMAKGIKNKNLKAVATGGMYGGSPPKAQGQNPWQARGELLQSLGNNIQQGGGGVGGVLGALKKFRSWQGSQGAPQDGPQLQPGGAWQQRQPGFPGVGGTQSPMGGRGAGFSRQPRPFNPGLDQDFQAPQLASPAPPAPPAPVDFAPPKMQRAPAAGGAGPYGGFMGGQDIKQARPKPAQQDGFFGGFGRGYFG